MHSTTHKFRTSTTLPMLECMRSFRTCWFGRIRPSFVHVVYYWEHSTHVTWPSFEKNNTTEVGLKDTWKALFPFCCPEVAPLKCSTLHGLFSGREVCTLGKFLRSPYSLFSDGEHRLVRVHSQVSFFGSAKSAVRAESANISVRRDLMCDVGRTVALSQWFHSVRVHR